MTARLRRRERDSGDSQAKASSSASWSSTNPLTNATTVAEVLIGTGLENPFTPSDYTANRVSALCVRAKSSEV